MKRAHDCRRFLCDTPHYEEDMELTCDVHGVYDESEAKDGICPACYHALQRELYEKERDL